ncbi:MAG: peptidoglycan-binding protein [Bdellovibrionales bacterium]|nr:peptidoglycan-binding protein [Bdellovibrionales bacterium]
MLSKFNQRLAAVLTTSLAALTAPGCSEQSSPAAPAPGVSHRESSTPTFSSLSRLDALNDLRIQELSQGRPAYKESAALLQEQVGKDKLSLDEYQSRVLDDFLLSGGDLVITFGEASERVAVIHALLANANALEVSDVDGIFLEGTRKAVKEYQLGAVGRVTYDGEFSFRTVSGLLAEADGQVFSHPERQRRHEATHRLCSLVALGSPVLREDVKDVKELQTVLKGLGYAIDVDGILGSQTSNAVIDFQAQMGIVTDGVPGRQTLRYLLAQYYAASYSIDSD